MLLDGNLLFSVSQEVTSTTATVSTNTLFLGRPNIPPGVSKAPTVDLGGGFPMEIFVRVADSFVGNIGVTIDLQQSATDSGVFSTVASFVHPANSGGMPVGRSLPPFYVPQGVTEPYLRLRYTLSGTPSSGGKFTAGLVSGSRSNV